MRPSRGVALVNLLAGVAAVAVCCAGLASSAAAQPSPAPATFEPAGPPPPSPPAPPPTTYTLQPSQAALNVEYPLRRGWFGIVGLGGMGYVARPEVINDTSDKGSGVVLEAVAGRWIRDDLAVGARLEAHTDDATLYTDSSLTAVARFPVGATQRFYLEPGFGLGFHKTEGTMQTDSGLAVAMSGGYMLTRRQFAFDLRFGLAHLRIGQAQGGPELDHGLIWFGVALGLQ